MGDISWTPVFLRSQLTCLEHSPLIGDEARIGTQIRLIPKSVLSPTVAAVELGVSSSGKQEKEVPGVPDWSGEECCPSAESGSCSFTPFTCAGPASGAHGKNLPLAWG